jgi:phosphoserine phosphatase RsbU/P
MSGKARVKRWCRMLSKILIVDDEPDLELLIRQRFRRHVREQIYEFYFARNGQEALTTLQGGPAIDVVMSDIRMPVMDGLTLLGHLRDFQPLLGAVVMSAYGDMANIRAAMNLGAFDFLTKPIDFDDFETTLDRTLRQTRALRQAVLDRDHLVAVQQDLQTAAGIQRSFLPQGLPAEARALGVDVEAIMTPARAVGGDFYDFFLVGDHHLGVAVGDVSGKGMPAALFMAVSRTLLRANALRGTEPAECLTEVNRLLLRDSPSDLFVTLFYGLLDTRTGQLHYSNAGHPPPYLLRPGQAGRQPTPVAGKGGFPVGALAGTVYESQVLKVEPGATLFLYSDGLTEARNEERGMYSATELEEALSRCDRSSPEAVVRGIMDEVRRFVGAAPQADDLTALAVRYRG